MKHVIRLTESDLHRIVKESVQRIINEADPGIEKYEFGRDYMKNKENGTLWIDKVKDTLQQFGLNYYGGDSGKIYAVASSNVDTNNLNFDEICDALSICSGGIRKYEVSRGGTGLFIFRNTL